MLIISAGMPKSGSTYIFHLLNGLTIAAGHRSSLESTAKHGLEKIAGAPNNFVPVLTPRVLFRLWRVARLEGSYVLKTHEPLNQPAQLAVRAGLARVIYIYRDPRDCVLSALDYGRKLRERGRQQTFAKMLTFEDAYAALHDWLRTWRAYAALPGIVLIRYEDLLEKPEETLRRCESYLGLSITDEARQSVLWDYNRDNPDVAKTRMPLNKAVAFRYKTEMPPEQRQRFRDELGDSLTAMGYALD